jgi:hypothetical protein
MNVLKSRAELRKMKRGNLLKLAAYQRISKCLIGGVACRFYLHHKGHTFCVSEILGQSCQIEKLKRLEELSQEEEKIDLSLPLITKMEPVLRGEKKVEFKVYYKDDPTRSVVFLGKVMERRKKERGNNLKDLLNKAIMDYSDRVKDPSRVFLLGP